MELGKLDIHMQKNKLDSYFTVYSKINSKWIEELNIRAYTGKHLEENIGEALNDIGFGSDFLDDTKSTGNRRNNKSDIIKIKVFCTSMDMINRVKNNSHTIGENLCES